MADPGQANPLVSSPRGAQPNSELLGHAEVHAYKEIGGEDLKLYLFEPEEDDGRLDRPAILFFFSSFWEGGAIGQFAPHCALLASRGMVAMAVEYRVAGAPNFSSPLDSIADARSAFRWVRSNAASLRIDPFRIAGGGGAGGATLAVGAALLDGVDDLGEERTVPCRPDALVLFNPILDISKRGAGFDRFDDPKVAKAHSPIRNIVKEAPPTLILHGSADKLVPLRGSEVFTRKMRWKKNFCDLLCFDGHGHTFYNFNVSMEMYEATMVEVDKFLVGQGFLDPSDDAAGRTLVA